MAYNKVGPTSPMYWQARLRAAGLQPEKMRLGLPFEVPAG